MMIELHSVHDRDRALYVNTDDIGVVTNVEVEGLFKYCSITFRSHGAPLNVVERAGWVANQINGPRDPNGITFTQKDLDVLEEALGDLHISSGVSHVDRGVIRELCQKLQLDIFTMKDV